MNQQMEKFFVSHTKLDTYKTCPMQYFYKYVMRLEKKVSRRSTYVGVDIHKLIEQFYAHRTPEILENRLNIYELHVTTPTYESLIDSPEKYEPAKKKWEERAKELYEDTLTWRDYITKVIAPRIDKEQDGVKNEIGYNYVNDLIKIMGQYEYYYSADNIKVLDLEHKKYSDLGTYNGKEVVLTYISDAIVEINGVQYLMEHKSFSSDPMTFEETWLNVQSAQYVTELNKLGWNIKGVIWDNIKSVAPKDPNILKNGNYGKQYATQCLFSFITTDIIMQGLNAVIEEAQKYTSLVRQLEIENNYNNFLTRHMTIFNDNAVKAILNDSSLVIDVITNPNCTYYRNMGWGSCNNCSFKDLCQLEMLGHDSSDLINTLYTKGK